MPHRQPQPHHRRRTSCFNRGNGNLGEPNSVAWQFTETGYILFSLNDDQGERGIDPDELFMAALDAGAIDVTTSEDAVEVYTERNDFAQVKALSRRASAGRIKPDQQAEHNAFPGSG